MSDQRFKKGDGVAKSVQKLLNKKVPFLNS